MTAIEVDVLIAMICAIICVVCAGVSWHVDRSIAIKLDAMDDIYEAAQVLSNHLKFQADAITNLNDSCKITVDSMKDCTAEMLKAFEKVTLK